MIFNNPKNDRAIAAGITFICVLAILLLLFFGGLRWDRQELAISSTAEIMETEPEFYEPELLDAGEENSTETDAPSPGLSGEPNPAPQPQVAQASSVTPAEKPSSSSLNSANNESPLKTEPSLSDFKEAADALADKFKPVNGNNTTGSGVAGAGGDGTGVTGTASGRTFLSCPKPGVTLRHRTVVNVDVTINAEGRVIRAVASGSADASIRKKCEAAALGARWSPKPGSPDVRGTITFTITPK